MPVYYRSNQFEVTVTSTALALPTESWDMMEGADPVAASTPHFPGGEFPQVELGGLPKWTEGTVERAWSESLANVYKALANACGSLPIAVAVIQRGGGKPTGVVFSYTGVLLSAERPKFKANESVEAFLKITVGVDGSVG